MQLNSMAIVQYLVQATGYEETKSLEFLRDLVACIKPASVLELGTGFGASAAYMAAAIGNGRIVTVDNYDGGYANSPRALEENFKRLGFDGKVRFVKSTTHKTCEALKVAGIKIVPEIVFMDADHSQDGLAAEYRNIQPLLPKDHIIVVDDVAVAIPDVRKFVVETMEQYEYCLTVKNFHWGMAIACTNSDYFIKVANIIRNADLNHKEQA